MRIPVSLATLFLFSLAISSQEIELPEIIAEEYLDEINSNSVNSEMLETEDNLVKNISQSSNIFGYDFFNYMPSKSDPVIDIPLFSDYSISFNDELELIYFGNEDAILDLRVDLSGSVLSPEIGSVGLVGLTLQQANDKIKKLVSEAYLGTKSYLSVKKPSMRKISIIGHIKQPGTYLMNPFISLTEAIKYSGGLRDNASIRDIHVIDLNGSVQRVDLYDFLIGGKRTEDLNLKNGDTVVIKTTNKFVDISGEVHNPKIFEYKSNDNIESLIGFASNFTKDADRTNLYATVNNNNELISLSLNLDSEVGNLDLISIMAGSKTSKNNTLAKVVGTEVSSGIFEYKKGDNIEEVIKRLTFSKDIYPFFAQISQFDPISLKKEVFFFSLEDSKTYREISLGSNVEIRFYSRQDIESLYSNYINGEDSNLLYNSSTYYQKSLIIGNNSYVAPIIGEVTSSGLLNYFGIRQDLDFENILINFKSGEVSGVPLDSFIDSSRIISFNAPSKTNDYIEITMGGAFKNPGIYYVDSSTTLQEAYKLAGGINDQAATNSIVLLRDSILNRERKSLEASKSLLVDIILQSTASNKENMLNLEDVTSLFTLAESVEPVGRFVGEIGPGSIGAKNLILEDGDEVIARMKESSVTIAGEVINPVTVIYEPNFEINDYILMSGGYSPFAKENDLIIIRSNGLAVKFNNGFGKDKVNIRPGDTIIVQRDLEKGNNLLAISSIAQIISNIAFSAASLNAIRN